MTETARQIRLTYMEEVFVLVPFGEVGPFITACQKACVAYDRKAQVGRFTPDQLPHVMTSLASAGFTVLPTEAALGGMRDAIATLEKDAKEFDSDAVLYPFQRTGVAFLRAHARCLLADDMGLGKTIQVLKALPPRAATIVVCPSVVKSAWVSEVNKWRPDLTPVLSKKKTDVRLPASGEVVILNYELLPEDWAGDRRPTAIVFDEAHYLKNSKALRTKRAKRLAKYCERVWLLTGTPLMNKPVELWNVLQVAKVATVAFGTWRNFCRLFQAYPGQWGLEWGEPLPEAAESFYKVSLRRRKVDVLRDLPGKSYKVHPVKLKRGTLKKADYDPATFGAGDWTLGGDIAQFSELYAKLSFAKIPAMLEIVEQYEDTDTPLVVFSQHRAPVEVLADREGWAVITGDVPQQRRANIIEDFQAGKLLGIACTIQAAATGITLTHASNMLFVSRSFTPAVNAQAEDRINRIGQDNACQYTHIVSDHPLDERIEEILGYKQSLVDTVIEASVKDVDLLARMRELYGYAMEHVE